MANANDRLDNWFRQKAPLVDLEFERLKAERLERAQARLWADLDLDVEMFKQGRRAQMCLLAVIFATLAVAFVAFLAFGMKLWKL